MSVVCCPTSFPPTLQWPDCPAFKHSDSSTIISLGSHNLARLRPVRADMIPSSTLLAWSGSACRRLQCFASACRLVSHKGLSNSCFPPPFGFFQLSPLSEEGFSCPLRSVACVRLRGCIHLIFQALGATTCLWQLPPGARQLTRSPAGLPAPPSTSNRLDQHVGAVPLVRLSAHRR